MTNQARCIPDCNDSFIFLMLLANQITDSFDQKYLQKTLLEEGDKHLRVKESEVIIFRWVWSSIPRNNSDLLENVRGTIKLPDGSFVVGTRMKRVFKVFVRTETV